MITNEIHPEQASARRLGREHIEIPCKALLRALPCMRKSHKQQVATQLTKALNKNNADHDMNYAQDFWAILVRKVINNCGYTPPKYGNGVSYNEADSSHTNYQ